MKRKNLLAVIIIIIATELWGCSYKELEDSLKNHESNKNSSNEKCDEAESVEGEEGYSYGTGWVNELKLSSENVSGPGETLSYVEPFYNGELQYTLTGVLVSDSLNELGIEKEDVSLTNYEWKDWRTDEVVAYIDEKGDIISTKPEEKYQMLVLELTVHNISYDLEKSAIEGWLYVDSDIFCEEDLMKADGIMGTELCYFNLHQDETQYFCYSLDIGEQTNIRVGFLLSETYLENPLYYMIGFNYQFQETAKFFKIECYEE